MDGNKYWPLGWNWWQYKLRCPSGIKPPSKEKHPPSESSAPALSTTPLTPSALKSCSLFEAKDGWGGGRQSWGPCCIIASHNRSAVNSWSHVRALQRYKCGARWGNCKGVKLNKLVSEWSVAELKFRLKIIIINMNRVLTELY